MRRLFLDIDFVEFFNDSTGGNFKPYPYQIQLGTKNWTDIIKVPTGMGKTAGIIISWLYNRFQKNSETPRRLVYCLSRL